MSSPQPQPDTTQSVPPEASPASATAETLPNPYVAVAAETPRFGTADQSGAVGKLGKYHVQKELGRGGMGAVYLAFDERLQRRVALKVMLPGAAANATAKDRFLREARAAAQISSDYVVSIHEADEIDGIPYIALQYLQGHPLDEYLRDHDSPSIPQVIRIGQETALGLEAAHQLGLVHRDIKPGNLWLEAPNGRVKILDFGLARQQSDDIHLTKSGAVIGTPAFMSPEQGRGEPVDHRSDLFSLGGVLYRLCTGQLPFRGSTTMAILTSLAVDTPIPVRELNPNVPTPLEKLIHRLLAKPPAQRPPTAKAVADELAAILSWMQAGQSASGANAAMAISVQDSNPFECVADASVPTQSAMQSEALEAELPRKPFPTLLVAALLAVAGAAFLLTKPQETDIAKPEPERTPTNPPNDPKPVLPVSVLIKELAPKGDALLPKEPDRVAAEWVLNHGVGSVRVNDEERTIKNAADLPTAPFRLTAVWRHNPMNDSGYAAFQGCKNLVTVDIHDSGACDDDLVYLHGSKNLTSLDLRKTKVTAAGMKALAAALPRCKIEWDWGTVESKSPDRLAAEYVLGIGGVVRLSGSDRELELVGELPPTPFQLGELNLTQNPRVTDTGLAACTHCKSLTFLSLRGTTVGDAGLAHFSESKNLQFLMLMHTRIGDVGLAHLRDCKNLTFLQVSFTKVTDAGLAVFDGCQKLTMLDLGVTQVSDAGLRHFKECKNLERLYLSETSVSDAGVANFKECQNLIDLYLDDTRISDATLKELRNNAKLAHLRVQKTKVTPEGVKALAAALPHCKIEWDGGVFEPKK